MSSWSKIVNQGVKVTMGPMTAFNYYGVMVKPCQPNSCLLVFFHDIPHSFFSPRLIHTHCIGWSHVNSLGFFPMIFRIDSFSKSMTHSLHWWVMYALASVLVNINGLYKFNSYILNTICIETVDILSSYPMKEGEATCTYIQIKNSWSRARTFIHARITVLS